MADDISLIVGVDYSELTGLVKTTAQTKAALGSIAKEFANTGSQSNYMNGINKLVAAQSSLDKSARLSRSEIMKLGNQMKQEAQFANALTRATTGLGGSLQQTGRRTNQLGVLMQQTGYQVGDFAVQVQSGTNVMVALGQQATQLVGTFGMLAKSTMMIGLFAGLGIAIPILTGIAAAFMRTAEASDKSAIGVKAFTEALKKAKEASSELNREIQLLLSGFKTEEEFTLAKQVLAAQAKVNEAQQFSASARKNLLDIEAKAQGRNIGNLGRIEKYAKQAVIDSQKKLDSAREELEVLQRRQAFLAKEKEFAEDILGSSEGLAASTKAQLDMYAEYLEVQDKAFEAGRERANEFYDVAVAGQKELNEEAADLGRRLGLAFGTALDLIRQAKAEAMVGLDAFGGAGEFKYSTSSKFTPPKPKKAGAKKKDPLAELKKRITLEEELFGKTEAQRQVIQALGVDYEKVYGKPATDELLERINKLKELQEEEAKIADLAQTIGSAMEDSFMSMVDGTSSVKDAFRDMARDIVAHLYKVLVVQEMINSFGGMLSGSSNPILSKIGGALESYEGGGYTGSGSRSGGMDGRGGRLAMIHPRETVVDHTKAGSGGTGEAVVVNQTFNFAANGDDSVKKLIAQAAPQIASMTQKQIMDSRRRGGAMKSTFG